MAGADVAAMLIDMGLPQDLAVKEGRRRADRLAADAAGAEHPAVATLVVEEDRHRKLKDEFSRAFQQAQSKKERGSKK